ncbi:MAG: glycosyltransferase [Actinomycetota bacterium]
MKAFPEQEGGLLIQTVAVDYQQEFYRSLSEATRGMTLLSGRRTFDRTIRAVVPSVPALEVRNVFLMGDRLLWQVGVLRPALRAEWLIAEMNPRILSTWVLLACRRLLRRPTALWGHAFPRLGPDARTGVLRGPLRRIAHAVIVYSEREALALAERQPEISVVAAPNALYRRADIRTPSTDPESVDGFICVGRLVEGKRPMLLLEAFSRLTPDADGHPVLHLVGEGPLEPLLRSRAEELGLDVSRVAFHGQLSEREELRELYARAVASVSPGYVGLALIQSLSFGIPQIVADCEPHSPEIAAADLGRNSVMFQAGSVEDLARRLRELWSERTQWVAARHTIAEECASSYSVDVMAERMRDALDLAATACKRSSAGL